MQINPDRITVLLERTLERALERAKEQKNLTKMLLPEDIQLYNILIKAHNEGSPSLNLRGWRNCHTFDIFSLAKFPELQSLKMLDFKIYPSISTLPKLNSLSCEGRLEASDLINISELAQLEKLTIGGGNTITRVKGAVLNLSKFANLKSLIYSNCSVSGFPDRIDAVTQLTLLIFKPRECNAYQREYPIPSDIAALVNLRTMKIRCLSLPNSFQNFTKLKVLEIESSNIEALPSSLMLASLRELSFLGKKLQSLPESIGDLSNLNKLKLVSDQLTRLPESVTKLAKLTQLHLSSPKLETLPKNIGFLRELTSFHLTALRSLQIPESIGNLKKLTNLELIGGPYKLPESIGDLRCLNHLHVKERLNGQINKDDGRFNPSLLSFNAMLKLASSNLDTFFLENKNPDALTVFQGQYLSRFLQSRITSQASLKQLAADRREWSTTHQYPSHRTINLIGLHSAQAIDKELAGCKTDDKVEYSILLSASLLKSDEGLPQSLLKMKGIVNLNFNSFWILGE